MTDHPDRGDPTLGVCRVCHRRCSPYETLCVGCREDRDMGYDDPVDDSDEEAGDV